jgi:hypothetical protein
LLCFCPGVFALFLPLRSVKPVLLPPRKVLEQCITPLSQRCLNLRLAKSHGNWLFLLEKHFGCRMAKAFSCDDLVGGSYGLPGGDAGSGSGRPTGGTTDCS